MKLLPITPRQLELLRFIHRFRQEHDIAPCHREMMEAMDVNSTCGIADHLMRLEAKGCIVRRPRLQRAISLTEAGLRLVAEQRTQSDAAEADGGRLQ